MIATLVLAAAVAASAPEPSHEMYLDKDGCRWVRPLPPAKKKIVPKKPAAAASAASAPASAPLYKPKPRKKSLWKPAEPDWELINCAPPAEPAPETPQDAPFTPVPADSAPPTFETLAGPPSVPEEPPCECFAGPGPTPYFAPPTGGGLVVIGTPHYTLAAPIPEPSIIYLLLSSAAAMLVLFRRRRD